MPDSIDILLVEDDELFRLGLSTCLLQDPTIGLIVEVGDSEQALATLRERDFDIVMLDLILPGASGLEICQHIHKLYPDLPILILTACADDRMVLKLVEAGAKGYCLKGIGATNLRLAIHSLHLGATWWDARASHSIYQAICQFDRVPILETRFNLTTRELQVLKLVANGKSNREIAEVLFVAAGTVRVHVHSILQKMSATDRTQAAIIALQNQLID